MKPKLLFGSILILTFVIWCVSMKAPVRVPEKNTNPAQGSRSKLLLKAQGILPIFSPVPFVRTESSQSKIEIVKQIISSRNDNDPRLDTLLKTLSSEEKKRLREYYWEIPIEHRNDRGMIVFLLGRNLEDPSDYAFIREILDEPHCYSLKDCSKRSKFYEDIDSITLSYPQVVAVIALSQKALSQKAKTLPVPSEVLNLLRQASISDQPMIKRIAQHALHGTKTSSSG